MAEVKFEVPSSLNECTHTWVVAGDVVLCLTQEGNIPMKNWESFLADVSKPEIKALLAASIGIVGVGSVHRKMALPALKNTRIAAVLGSQVARGVATALGWLGLNINGFTWNTLDEAINYLDSQHFSSTELRKIFEDLLQRSEAPELAKLVDK